MGVIYKNNKDIDKSLKIFKNIESNWGKLFGKHHPQYAIILDHLSSIYFEKNDFKNADKYFNELNSSTYYNINNVFDFLSEQEKDKFIESTRYNFEKFNNYALERSKSNPSIIEKCYDNELKNKGLSLRSSNMMKNSILKK